MNVKVTVKGLKELQTALKRFPAALKTTYASMREAEMRFILDDRGGGKPMYPRETAANRPPTPYYIRGIGTQYKRGNAMNSQQMDTKFYVRKTASNYTTILGNRASYAPYVIGNMQSAVMKRLGWKTMTQVAKNSMPKIIKAWNKIIKETLLRLRVLTRGG